jgi:hypothetical protein
MFSLHRLVMARRAQHAEATSGVSINETRLLRSQ